MNEESKVADGSHFKSRSNVRNRRCYNCDEVGYYKRNSLKQKGKEVKAEFACDGTIVIIAGNSFNDGDVVLIVTTSSSGDEWMLDSECSNHITSHNWFSTYQCIEGNKVLMENVE